MPVKPARSMNITLIGRIAPPRRAPLPSLISRFDQVGRNVFPERGKPLRHVADRAGEILDLGQPRRMPLHLVEVKTLDMPDLVRPP